ncbi:SWI/SNF-related matrix-associated actin-dependent regulator of chromatin subfamily A containing DEAD/H box 1 homolog [Toxorhynchites rutilus septentrionalis]|uniref:SWI/SNF-related matrix-associated actin-dependent regulator of chromatin subfamily A containing DEAD/H box 1 homolog n=1 Tax=Toxorhynchites rutilus septentrionalis TaxID=329112 RepID=UPI002478BFF2|nr:SWI/SNF-related matrix-associated actin-dependent regulator of chromatin subfamily A containing DEAD/H box 1 homolog [Toxorhynchites rutilus septentrionalis]
MSLRQYRKPTHGGSNGAISTESAADQKLELVPGRRRIQALPDSESEGEGSAMKNVTAPVIATPVPIPTVGPVSASSAAANVSPGNSTSTATIPSQVLTVKEKEQCLQSVRAKRPDVDAMDVQDALVRNGWSVEKSLDELKSYVPSRKRVLEVSPVLPHKAAILSNAQKVTNPNKKRRMRPVDGDSEDDSDRPKERVFDSDEDSEDNSQNYGMSRDRKSVFEFFNNATVNELSAVKKLSTKKVDLVMELRPFKHWDDLVDKLKSHKSLQTDLLNYAQEYLSKRNSLVTIMNKCRKMVQKLESAIAVGGGVVEQPSNIPEGFKLAEYQMVGLNWLTVMHRNDMNGILADEMGLGKTIQVISFLAWLKENDLISQPQLIVVPSSTLDNWDNELRKWCPELIVMKYYGNQDERRMIRIDWAKNGISDVDVVLTTYHMMGASGEEKKMWRVTAFQYVIFDEAHMLKNMTSQRYENLLRIRAARRLLLTGTPLQNNLLELMSLLCFVMPQLFGGKVEDIKALFQGRIKASKLEGGEDQTTFEKNQIERAKQIMKPFILRRLKKDVLNHLPPKTENIVKVPMLDSQKEKYLSLVSEYQNDTGVIRSTTEISGMAIMMDMRKLANHPLLLRYYFTDAEVRKIARKLAGDSGWKGNNVDEVFQDIAYMSDFMLYKLKEKYTSLYDLRIPDKLITASGKFRQLDELLPKLKSEGHRVLIFSQFVMMLDIMEKYLSIRKYGYLRLDGQTAVTDRQEMIDQYTQDPSIFIFLLSTKAGGLGINLTAADTVIIHDIDFNPYNDKQAEDRSHRMGQTKPVTIYKLISDGTIEEGMLMIAQEKLKLEKDVTEEGEDKKEEHKCMVRLLTMALGMDENKAETILKNESPKKNLEDVDF